MRIVELSSESRDRLLEDLLKRSPNSYGEFEGRVAAILADVKERRDAALFEYTKKFDGADISTDNLVVTEEEIREAYETVDPSLVEIIRKALVNIRAYHEKNSAATAGLTPSPTAPCWARRSRRCAGWASMYPAARPFIRLPCS